jgi:hypothetical protein
LPPGFLPRARPVLSNGFSIIFGSSMRGKALVVKLGTAFSIACEASSKATIRPRQSGSTGKTWSEPFVPSFLPVSAKSGEDHIGEAK